ncbi:MAG: hypothetical protein ABIJ34_09235 [archaeon]
MAAHIGITIQRPDENDNLEGKVQVSWNSDGHHDVEVDPSYKVNIEGNRYVVFENRDDPPDTVSFGRLVKRYYELKEYQEFLTKDENAPMIVAVNRKIITPLEWGAYFATLTAVSAPIITISRGAGWGEVLAVGAGMWSAQNAQEYVEKHLAPILREDVNWDSLGIVGDYLEKQAPVLHKEELRKTKSMITKMENIMREAAIAYAAR